MVQGGRGEPQGLHTSLFEEGGSILGTQGQGVRGGPQVIGGWTSDAYLRYVDIDFDQKMESGERISKLKF